MALRNPAAFALLLLFVVAGCARAQDVNTNEGEKQEENISHFMWVSAWRPSRNFARDVYVGSCLIIIIV